MAKPKVVASLEAQLWASANILRGTIDASKYKDIVLGIIFLKYVSDRAHLRTDALTLQVPAEAQWSYILSFAESEQIGSIIDAAFAALERDNLSLRDALPQIYADSDIDQRRLGEVVALFAQIDTLPIEEDALGRIYEYFLAQFASMGGKGGGEFYTPSSVVELLVDLIEPYEGTIYDPCCGSGGMFVQAQKFVKAHGGHATKLSLFGQELNADTWRLARMNVAMSGLNVDLGVTFADTFHADQFPQRQFDYILANPPFNVSEWGQSLLQNDARWQWGLPATNNANYAWLSHIVSKLQQTSGVACVILPNGSLSSQSPGEGNIRAQFVADDLVECIVALPDKLFYTTSIPVCVWILRRTKKRPGEVLFIDARQCGSMMTRRQRQLDERDIERIAQTYHRWLEGSRYNDELGFSKAVPLPEIKQHHNVLTPSQYVGMKDNGDTVKLADNIDQLVAELADLMVQSSIVDEQIKHQLSLIGYPISKK